MYCKHSHIMLTNKIHQLRQRIMNYDQAIEFHSSDASMVLYMKISQQYRLYQEKKRKDKIQMTKSEGSEKIFDKIQ